MDIVERTRRRERYERISAFPVFVLGMIFIVGFVEVVSSGGSTGDGQQLMAVGWIGFVLDLIWRWVIDEDPRTFPKRHWFAVVAVLIPVLRLLFIAYVFVRLAVGRQRLRSRVQVYAAYLTTLVIVFGAALVLAAERSYPGSNIKNYGEAFWWACVTVTTVGYGDYVPVSPTGRAVATLMLVNGVVLISVVTAVIASRFVSDPDSGEQPVSLDDLDDRLERIETALAALAVWAPRRSAEVPAPDDGSAAAAPDGSA